MHEGPVIKVLAERLGGRLLPDGAVGLSRDGVQLSIRMSLVKATWTVAVDCRMIPDQGRPAAHPRVNGRPRLGLWFEGASERLGKRLTLNLEANTGDEAFDRRVYIHSHAPIPVVTQVLAAPEARAAVLGILDADWEKLVIDAPHAMIGARKRVRVGGEAAFCDDLNRVASHLARLAKALPGFEGDKIWRTRIVDVAAPIAGFATLVCGAILTVWGAHDYPIEDSSAAFTAAGWGLALWPVLALLVFMVARKGAEGLGTWAACTLPMLVGLPLLAAGSMLVANGRYDRGEEMVQTVEIVHKESHRGSKSTRYYLYTKDYRDPPRQDRLEMQVEREPFEAAQVGGTLHLVFKPGRLGHRWLASLEVAK
jgi:hypothetical protein